MKLHAFRQAHGLSLRTLAARIGVSAPTLSRIENGHPCGRKTASKIVAFTEGAVGWTDLPMDVGVHHGPASTDAAAA